MDGQGKTAVVTGASSGIGWHTALRLAGAGFAVMGAARRLERLKELAEQAPGITPVQVDLSDPRDTERFCREIAGQRPVSVLVNNAGYALRGGLEGLDLEAVQRLFQVNLFP